MSVASVHMLLTCTASGTRVSISISHRIPCLRMCSVAIECPPSRTHNHPPTVATRWRHTRCLHLWHLCCRQSTSHTRWLLQQLCEGVEDADEACAESVQWGGGGLACLQCASAARLGRRAHRGARGEVHWHRAERACEHHHTGRGRAQPARTLSFRHRW